MGEGVADAVGVRVGESVMVGDQVWVGELLGVPVKVSGGVAVGVMDEVGLCVSVPEGEGEAVLAGMFAPGQDSRLLRQGF